MIKVLIGDMFESSAKTLVNTVNCVGVMGKGIAQEFKKRFPDMSKDYEYRCDTKGVEPGLPYYYEDMLDVSIVNFPTKNHWRSPSRLQDIVNGLDIFLENYKSWDIKSVAFPPLGCGNGGLEWSLVGPIMYQKLSNLDIPVEIYAPYGTTKKQLMPEFLNKPIPTKGVVKGKKNIKLNPSWIALLEILNQLHKQPYSSPVGRTIFQKICYVFTEQGVDTGFYFNQGSYGPFSNEVKDALSVFANMNLIQEQQLGRMNALRTGPGYEKISSQFKEDLKPLQSKIDKTVDLFTRIKTTEQAEEVATVLFAVRKVKNEQVAESVTEQDLYDFIVEWKKKWTKPDKKKAVASTIRNLVILDWIKLKFSDSLPVS